jgi:RNA polymerase sigma factor (sigma-70 family)
MHSTVLDATLACIRRRAEAAGPSPSDRDLLDRFTANGDQAAFAALVRRHGGRVLATCRQVLADPADVDDAFQATFLVLVDKALAIRWQPSFGGWLSAVAHRVSVRARDAARRRQRHEDRVAGQVAEAVVQDPSWREACGVLHEELDRLPDRYRLPLVLCYLESKSRDEAAAQLGWSVGSMKGRLERGRDKLRRRLERRGITLSAGLLAALAGETRAGVPMALVRATVESAGGVPSAAVAALVHGASVVTHVKFAVVAVALSLLAGGTGVGLWARQSVRDKPVALAAGQAPDPAKPPAPAPAAVASKMSVHGRVLDPDGKPVAGAKLFLPPSRESVGGMIASLLPPRPVATTDGEGRFAFQADPPPPGLGSFLPVIAVAPGFGPDWANAGKPGPDGDLTLRLVADDVPIRGRVVDLEGRPVPGATVRIESLEAAAGNDLGQVLKAAAQNEPIWPQTAVARRLSHPRYAGLAGTVTADSAGRFEIRGVGRERIAVLQIEGASIEHRIVRIVVRPGFDPQSLGGPHPEPGYDQPPPRPTVYGPDFVHSARPSQLVTGTVTDKATGRPLAGVGVNGWVEVGWGQDNAHTTTDAQGRYRLVGLPKVPQRQVTFFAADTGAPYLNAGYVVADVPGVQPITFDVGLVRGAAISGRITDKVTGKPIKDAGICYNPLAGNPFYDKTPGSSSHSFSGIACNTDADGRYRLVALPGPGLMTAQVNIRGDQISTYARTRFDPKDKPRAYLQQADRMGEGFTTADGHLEFLSHQSAYRVIDPAAGATALTCDLQFDPGLSLSGTIVDPTGKPLVGCMAVGLTATYDHVRTLSTAAFTAIALDPQQSRTVAFMHKDRKLAGLITLTGAEATPPTVKLEPCGTVTGRVLDADGRPIAGVGVQIGYYSMDLGALAPNIRTFGPAAETDRDGRFRIDGLIADQSFGIGFRSKGRVLEIDQRKQNQAVKSGAVLDFGDLRTKPYGEQ